MNVKWLPAACMSTFLCIFYASNPNQNRSEPNELCGPNPKHSIQQKAVKMLQHGRTAKCFSHTRVARMWKSENAKMANAKCAGSLLQQELSCAKECCEFNCRQGGHSHSRAQSGCWWWGGGGVVVFGGWVLVFVLMRRLKWAKDKSMQSSESPEFCPIHCNKTASADLGRTIL